MYPFDSMRNLIFLVWRKRPFLFATVMIATVILLVLQYQSVTSSNSNHVTSSSSSSYAASFSSANAEPVVLRNMDAEKRLEYRFDGRFNPNSFEQPNSPPKVVSSFVDESKQKSHNAVVGDEKSPQPHAKYKLVHFDLKGAPPKLSYLIKVLSIIKEAGANGILLEYEDMFPWTGILEPVKSPLAYSLGEINQLLREAASLELEVVPLVQTFGHLEYVLKIQEFRHLRETDLFPAAICPSRNESFDLVTQIIDQVMAVHGNKGKWLHIGADEVFQIGQCNLCRVKDREQIYLDHITKVASYVIRKYPGVRPIIWDDMLRNIPSFRLKQLSGLVEPMVWTYVRDIYHFVPYPTWMTFGEAFDNIWAASAFKGAFGETLTVPNVKMHLENNEAWVQVMNEQKEYFKSFRGIAITGWQRYDHLATLCETFAASLPSLIINLLTVANGKFDSNALSKKFDQILSCKSNSYQPTFDLETDPYLWTRAASCSFPGSDIFHLTQNVAQAVKRVDDYIYDVTIHKAWMTEYNIRHNITYLWRVDEGMAEYDSNYYHITSLVRDAEEALSQVYNSYTVAEWIEQNIYPYILKLEKVKENAENLRKARVWPVRPLPVNKDLAERFLSSAYKPLP